MSECHSSHRLVGRRPGGSEDRPCDCSLATSRSMSAADPVKAPGGAIFRMTSVHEAEARNVGWLRGSRLLEAVANAHAEIGLSCKP